MATLISLRSAVKSFGARTVLNGLDIEVDEAARIGVVGQNGSGKSTLLRILAGLDEPDSEPPVRRRGMTAAYLPQLVGADSSDRQASCTASRNTGVVPALSRRLNTLSSSTTLLVGLT